MKISKKTEANACCENCNCKHASNSNGGAVYGMGVLGAAFYFFPHFVGFAGFFIALFKSIFWPAYLVYESLSLLGLK